MLNLTNRLSQETISVTVMSPSRPPLKANLAQVAIKSETLFISDIRHRCHGKAFHTPFQHTVRLYIFVAFYVA